MNKDSFSSGETILPDEILTFDHYAIEGNLGLPNITVKQAKNFYLETVLRIVTPLHI